MKTIKIKFWSEVPKNYTGIAKYPNGDKFWLKNGNLHREDGPAIEFANGTKEWRKNGKRHRLDGPAEEWPNGYKEWYLEGNPYEQININDYVILDHYKGECDLMWYKLLDKDKISEHPDIPGLITK